MSDIVDKADAQVDHETLLRQWADTLSIPSGTFVNEDLRSAADTITTLRAQVAQLKADKAKLREAVRKLRACPALFDIAPEDMDEEDVEAERFARLVLAETGEKP